MNTRTLRILLAAAVQQRKGNSVRAAALFAEAAESPELPSVVRSFCTAEKTVREPQRTKASAATGWPFAASVRESASTRVRASSDWPFAQPVRSFFDDTPDDMLDGIPDEELLTAGDAEDLADLGLGDEGELVDDMLENADAMDGDDDGLDLVEVEELDDDDAEFASVNASASEVLAADFQRALANVTAARKAAAKKKGKATPVKKDQAPPAKKRK